MLMKNIGELQTRGLIGSKPVSAWVSHRIPHLEAREKPMWQCLGNDDPSRVNPDELDDAEFIKKTTHLTLVHKNLCHTGSPYNTTKIS